MRVLIAGWFSYEQGHATGGDLLARDLVAQWLERAGHPYDVAVAPPFEDGIPLDRVDPSAYTHAVFVCGPFERKALEADFLGRFAHCFVAGVNLTMITPLETWNPFDFLIERDSSVDAHPDVVFGTRRPLVPVVGVCLVEPYEGAIDAVANAAIERLVASREMSVVPIDTRLDVNSTGLRTPAEIESLLARMDVVVTTRLHGTVMALKNGVPAIAIDPEAGGAKIKRQGATIGWPLVFTADAVTDEALREAFDYCLTDEARALARSVAERAARVVEGMGREFVEAIGRPDEAPRKTAERLEFARGFAPPPEPPPVAADAPPPARDPARPTTRSARERLMRLLRPGGR